MPKPIFVPPGEDPTQKEYDLNGPTISGCLFKAAGAVVVGALVIAALLGWFNARAAADAPTATPTATATPAATGTPEPTLTPYPTYTAYPTWTPNALNTPAPTFTPTEPPTLTPTPSNTPLPPNILASWTPGPWILTRFATERP